MASIADTPFTFIGLDVHKDSIIAGIIDGFSGHPVRTEYWELLGCVLKDGGLRSRVDALRRDGFEDISTIRCLDIAIWMSGSRSTQAKHAQDPSS